MKTKKQPKLIENLRDNYNVNFGFIERVIRSCTTKDQLENAITWGYEYFDRVSTHERKAITNSKWTKKELQYDTLDDYFDLKRVILGQAVIQTSIKIQTKDRVPLFNDFTHTIVYV